MFLKLKHSTELTDAELILQYKKMNDPELLGHLYSRYVTLVFGLCLKYLEDRERSKDMVMHIFEQLVLDLHRHEVHNFKSWLYVFSKNHCLMELRKGTALKRKETAWLENHPGFMEYQDEIHLIDSDGQSVLNEAPKRLRQPLETRATVVCAVILLREQELSGDNGFSRFG